MNVRAKFRVMAKTKTHGINGTNIEFQAIYDQSTEENRRFTKYTPSGKLTMWIDNSSVEEEFELGNCYYLDFTKADK